jgi:anti-anti-sigma factor
MTMTRGTRVGVYEIMDIETDAEGSNATICVRGRLTHPDCAALQQAVARLVDEGYRQVLIELTDVSYVDSAGLGALVVTITASQGVA